jgi:bifunctional enzyme CysN/CysC
MENQITEKLSIVFVGHVDHGKSTVIGRLLADTGTLPVGKLEQIQAYCELNMMPFEYAFLIDALKDERRQNITIDSARVFFKSARRNYIIIDAPGHVEFVKNMVTGAARAEAALLVIDAEEGIQENSLRHGNLLSMLSIRQMVVLINKMDLVNFNQERFNEISTEYNTFLHKVGLEPIGFIPVSARLGDNISSHSEKMPWYTGKTVLETLDSFEKEKPLEDRPFRMPVQDVYRFTSFGDARRIIAGNILSGKAKVGDEIVFYPSGKHSTIATLEAFNAPDRQEMHSGEAAGFTLKQQVYVKRGEMVARADEPLPFVTRRLRVSIFWLGKEPLLMKKSYIIKLGTARTHFKVERVVRVMEVSSLENEGARKQVGRYEMAECILALDHPIAVDRADFLMDTSRFVIVDGYEIRGGGIVLEELPDSETDLRAGVRQREAHWIPSDVTLPERAARYNQRPGLVIITGKKGVGRKRLARALESNLFHYGNFVYYLGMGSVVYGVDADILAHLGSKTRHEHIRRMAEIANIFIDVGLLLIITAVEISADDLNLFHTILDPTSILTVWVGEGGIQNNTYDMHVVEQGPVEEEVNSIVEKLREEGFVLG